MSVQKPMSVSIAYSWIFWLSIDPYSYGKQSITWILILQSVLSTRQTMICMIEFCNDSSVDILWSKQLIFVNKLIFTLWSFILDSLMNNGMIYYKVYWQSRNVQNLANSFAKHYLMSISLSIKIDLNFYMICIASSFFNSWQISYKFWITVDFISGWSSSIKPSTNGNIVLDIVSESKLITIYGRKLIKIVLIVMLLSFANTLIKSTTLLLYWWMNLELLIHKIQGGTNAQM